MSMSDGDVIPVFEAARSAQSGLEKALLEHDAHYNPGRDDVSNTGLPYDLSCFTREEVIVLWIAWEVQARVTVSIVHQGEDEQYLYIVRYDGSFFVVGVNENMHPEIERAHSEKDACDTLERDLSWLRRNGWEVFDVKTLEGAEGLSSASAFACMGQSASPSTSSDDTEAGVKKP